MRFAILLIINLICILTNAQNAWVRINQLGYPQAAKKIAVWCSREKTSISIFKLIDSATGKTVYSAKASKPFGAYGPFAQSQRLDFSSFQKSGTYYLTAAKARSSYFKIDKDVYKGAADFCLRYMRQQRSGFNPFLKDSCHTHDGYVVYGPSQKDVRIEKIDADNNPTGNNPANIREGDFVNVSGGWHDASDYLQYATTSANATYHLLMAYRDFKNVFSDKKMANGLDGKNGKADVLDEARWGLGWLLKMHPQPYVMFNQIADDRDHQGMRIPKEDSFYGRGYQRPVYFITGEPQGLFKYKNRTNGTSSTAAKFASAFALGYQLFDKPDFKYASGLMDHAMHAIEYAYKKLGVTQTAPGRAPYFYEEDNWVDDMELGLTALYQALHYSFSKNGPETKFKGLIREYLDSAFNYSKRESITPWLGKDTAKHYQWYPFINAGHYELAKTLRDKRKDTIISYYKKGIQLVWNKAKQNAFYRGVPYIWCSNNLTTSFAIQCYWYRELTGDKSFEELEAANFDWLFGLNPWGTSMVYGLPAWGDTPVDPHSAFTHLKNYPIDGGLVDGPVYGSIYKNLIGIKLYQPDEYAPFQSELAVYHDDYGDYSTNEPTMDGTASLIYLLAAKEWEAKSMHSQTKKATTDLPFKKKL